MERNNKNKLTIAEMLRIASVLTAPIPLFDKGGIVHGTKPASEIVLPKHFKTSPELEKMVRISNKMNDDYKAEMRKRYGAPASPQNCKVGKAHKTYGDMPALQVRAIFKKDFGPVGSVGRKAEQCPGPVLCDPAGRRSRIEWCGKCGKIE